MNRLLPLALATTLFVGCSALFGIEVPPLESTVTLEGDGGGQGGQASQAGEPAASGAGQSATGGRGAAGQPAGGRNAAGGGTGRGGKTNATGGTPGIAGRGGSTGEPPSEPYPDLGAACTRPGELACPGALAEKRLICQGGVWTGDKCADGRFCDRRTGVCAIPDGLCDDEDPGTTVCIYNATGDGRDAVKCGLDRVGIDIESCVFNCNETGCIPAVSETLLALERPPEIITEFAFWPGSTIPVCVTNPSDSAWAAIRDDIDRTWGRYAGIAFVGWEACNDESTGVKVTLLDPMPRCTGELGHIDRIGYPGSSGSLEITLCRGYVDAYGSGHSSSEALLRVVARHQFGHVLGFDDFHKAYYVWDFMSRGIDSAELDHYAFDLEHFYRLQQAYGRKPAGAFVDTRGNCLTVTGGKLSFATCDGSAFQSFRLENGELRYDDSGDCLSANEITGATSLASCTPPGSSPPPEQAWQPAEVEVRGYGGLCLFKDDTLPDLRLDTCSEPGKAGTRWRVEPVDGGRRIRLRLAGTATCAVVNPAGYLDLLACDLCPETDPECAILDRFELADALHLEHDGLCFATSMEGSPETTRPSPGIVLEPCALQHRMQWNLSGGWEDGTGRVLARWDTAGTPLLVARPMGEGPPEDEIFDFYFREAK